MRSWLAVEAMTKLTGKLSPPGSASGMIGNIWMPGMAPSFCCTTGRYAFVGVLARAPWLQHHSAEAAARIGDLKCESRVRDISEDFSSGIRITDRIVDRRVRRRGNDAKNHALIFFRRQFFRRHFGIART